MPRMRRRTDGAEATARDRRGRQRLDDVEIVPDGPASEVVLDEAEERFVLGASRRSWAVIERRYGSGALTRSLELVRGGAVTLRCPLDDQLRLGRPHSWRLTDAWIQRRARSLETRSGERETWRRRADAAADAVAETCPQLAAALRAARPLSPSLPVLVFAAEDLASGFVNDGPRAFSQRHFGHTKERDDVAHVLREAGVPADVLRRLGVRRSGRIGVAGPIAVSGRGGSYSARSLDGPQLLRTDQPELRLALEAPVPLVVIENLQAAETVADRYPDLAIVYSAGYMGLTALALIEALVEQATRVLLIPDADADGAAIAAAWLSVAPSAEVVDIGDVEHAPTEPLPGWARRRLQDQLDGLAGGFAAAILARGYALEEEMLIVRALALRTA